MNEVWLSIKAWTQRLILAAAVVYAGLFFYKNNDQPVKFWYWFKPEHESTVFMLSTAAFFAGVICTIVANTALKTIRQIKELRSRGRQEKMEREISEMKTKAAMLQTRPVEGDAK
jgi:lysylphosphatidylglycerol synthetase-like protein (DUF2156 family)